MNNPNGWQWETWEDAVLDELYKAQGWVAVKRRLPHRTKGAITARAYALGLRGEKCRQKRKPQPNITATYWTPAVREACALLTAWRGPVSPNLGLRP